MPRKHSGDATFTGEGTILQQDDALVREVARLRRTLLKLGHSQEMFQQRIEEQVERMSRQMSQIPRREEPAGGGAGALPLLPDPAQQRALIEVDQAVLQLLDLAQGSPQAASDPRSVREGLVLLQIRVRNLQRSFGLEPVAAVGRRFDDRLHQAYGVCDRPDLDDGEIAEEVLPGYRLRDRVVRPALVIVNRRTVMDPKEEEE